VLDTSYMRGNTMGAVLGQITSPNCRAAAWGRLVG